MSEAMKLVVFTDGGARGNPGPAAAAFVVYEAGKEGAGGRQDKIPRRVQGKFLGVATNNVAEYSAVVEALEWIKNEMRGTENGTQSGKDETTGLEICFFLDSSLVVNQLNGRFKVKDGRLRELTVAVRQKEQALAPAKITYTYVPREQNREADAMVNEILDEQNYS